MVVTAGGQIWAVPDVHEPRPARLAAPAFKGAPNALAALAPGQTLSGGAVALVAAGGTLWEVDEGTAEEHPLARLGLGGAASVGGSSAGPAAAGAPSAPPAASASGASAGNAGVGNAGGNAGGAAGAAAVAHIAPSPDGQLVALFTADGRLTVLTADLSRKVG